MPSLDTIIAGVTDMERAAAFYRDVLGFRVDYQSEHWCTLDLDGVRIGLHAGGGKPGGWTLCFRTPDLDALRQTLVANGVKPEDHQTPRGLILSFQDPDGNPVQAIQLD